uniref:Uncharacterized protein n=1 Tax=Arundo donax TaxID=35708 RepID=A0A0A9G620_ARUDO
MVIIYEIAKVSCFFGEKGCYRVWQQAHMLDMTCVYMTSRTFIPWLSSDYMKYIFLKKNKYCLSTGTSGARMPGLGQQEN